MIWPYPEQFSNTIDGTTVYLRKNQISFVLKNLAGKIENPEEYPILKEAIQERYPKRIFYDWIWEDFPTNTSEPTTTHGTYSFFLQSVEITISNFDSNTLTLGVDESYSLKIEKDKPIIFIKSETVWGALRGLLFV